MASYPVSTMMEIGQTSSTPTGADNRRNAREVMIVQEPDYFNDPVNKSEIKEADVRYQEAADDAVSFDFFTKMNVPTSRSPYKGGHLMCRGAAYHPKFKEYIEKGGVARFKNSVVTSIRVNSFHSLDEMSGSFQVSYFLDMAFWVPRYDEMFYNDPTTVGRHARYEPHIHFPDTLSAKIVHRTHEFSKHPAGRRHEVQLGQNKETMTRLKEGKWLQLNKQYNKGDTHIIRACDPKAHWPRMWRVLSSDEEISALEDFNIFGSNSHMNDGKGADLFAAAMRAKLTRLDEERGEWLKHPKEGILFLTHEIDAVCLEHFDLIEFPYDTQAMAIKVRVEKGPLDPLNRFLVPLCIDKAFFCTSRVTALVEWMIAKSLHWEVTAGAGGDPSRDGGKQRLIARVLVCRKSYYYTSHYIIMAFSISTISFAAFTIDPLNITARVNVVLTILLTVVAFNYVCQDKIPKVPYSTILDKFLICNHVAILIVGFIVLLISYIASNKDLSYNFIGLNQSHEDPIGGILFILWILGNAMFGGSRVLSVKNLRHNIDFSQQMEFLDFKKSSADNRYFIEEELKEPLLPASIENVLSSAWNYFCCLFTFQEYFKIQKRHRHTQRKKMLAKLESRGFEICGSNSDGEFFFDSNIVASTNRSSIVESMGKSFKTSNHLSSSDKSKEKELLASASITSTPKVIDVVVPSPATTAVPSLVVNDVGTVSPATTSAASGLSLPSGTEDGCSSKFEEMTVVGMGDENMGKAVTKVSSGSAVSSRLSSVKAANKRSMSLDIIPDSSSVSSSKKGSNKPKKMLGTTIENI